MITRAIYTYWTDEGDRFNSGFSTFGGFKRTFKKSLESVRPNFDEIVIYTDLEGKNKLESIGIVNTDGVSNVSGLEGRINELASVNFEVIDYNLYDFDPRYWNFPKLISYNLQTEPFLHIDTDVIFHGTINQSDLNSDIVTELIRSADIWNRFRKILPEDINNEYTPFLICSGIIGGNNLQIFKDIFNISKDIVKWDDYRLLVSPENRIAIEEITLTVLSNRENLEVKVLDNDNFIHYQSVTKHGL